MWAEEARSRCYNTCLRMPYYKDSKQSKGRLDGLSEYSSKKKEICKCCRKDLGFISGNISLFRGKCQKCHQKVCSSCVNRNLCHKCTVQNTEKLTPSDLMQLSGKRLIEIASTLHFHNAKGYEKSELVAVILALYGMKWERPIPQQPRPIDEAEERSRLQHSRDLQYPDRLMQLSNKELLVILESLDISKDQVQAREKGELVKLILEKHKIHKEWKPPVPQQPCSNFRPDNRVGDDGGNSDIIRTMSANQSPTSPENGEGGNFVDHLHLHQEQDAFSILSGTSSTTGAFSVDPAVDNVTSISDISSVDAIQDLKVSQLKTILQDNGIDLEGCCEKADLANQVTVLWRRLVQNHTDDDDTAAFSCDQPSSTMRSSEPHDVELEQQDSSWNGNDNGPNHDVEVDESNSSQLPLNPNIILPSEVPNLREISTKDELALFTNRQLKCILQKHSVDYSGCRERHEFLDKVNELWNESKKWGEVVDTKGDIPYSDLCKICMDAPMDCVLLNCGHIVSCTECGRQLPECPICRQYVVRVVHIFKV